MGIGPPSIQATQKPRRPNAGFSWFSFSHHTGASTPCDRNVLPVNDCALPVHPLVGCRPFGRISVGGLPAVPRHDVTVPVRRYETEDVTIPAAFVTIALPRYDAPFRPGPCTSLGDRRPHTGGGVCTHRGMDRRGPAGRRSKRGSTRSRELRRFNNCEQGKPDLALIHLNHPLGEADERRPRPR